MGLRHALLGLLAAAPASGYELTKHFELSLANVWAAKHSQIYPELKRMTEAGWVSPSDEGPRGRKDYTITDSGRVELNRWLTEERPDRSSRNEAMLRVFFLWTLPPTEAVEYLKAEAEAYRDNLRALDEIDHDVPWNASGPSTMGRIALEQGRRWSLTMADWSDWAADQIRQGHTAVNLADRMAVSEP